MSSPYTREAHRAANALRDMRAIAETAEILRRVAAHDGHIDAHRDYVSINLADLVEAVGPTTTISRPRSARA